MGKPEIEKWDGGFVRRTAGGKAVYVIERRVNGVRYKVSTRCTTHRAAMAELARFEADPESYEPGGASKPKAATVVPPLTLTPERIEDFERYSREEKHNTEKWVIAQRRLIEWWAAALEGKDLRTLTIEEIEAPLKGQPGRAKRIATIKALYAWLVSVERSIAPTEDPTFRVLKVPQSNPAQAKKIKAISAEDYLAKRAQLEGKIDSRWIDGLDVLAGTGWHVTEVARFAAEGEVISKAREGAAGVLVCPRTKGGDPLRTAVSAPVLAAAKRLRKAGAFVPESMRRAIYRATKEHKIPDLMPGSFRHSVATHAIDSGADAKAASDFLGHKSPRTTRRFYATHATPAKVPTLI